MSGLGGVQDVRGSKGEVEGAPTLTIAGTLIGGGFAVQSEPDEAMNAVRDGIQSARDKADEATETARQKIDEATETARQKIDETTGAGPGRDRQGDRRRRIGHGRRADREPRDRE